MLKQWFLSLTYWACSCTKWVQKINFKSMLHEYLGYFRLLVFGFDISYSILVFWCGFFFSFFRFKYVCVWYYDFFRIKKACFRDQKCSFLGLTVVASWLVFSWFLVIVFCVLKKNIVVDSWFGPMLVHFFAKKTLLYAWLTNNLVVLYINNMFIMIFTSIRSIGGVNVFSLRN